MRNPHMPPEIAAVVDLQFPRVLMSATEDGCLVIACNADIIIWVRDGKIKQTWRRNPYVLP